MKAPFDRITIEPGKMGGQPCVRDRKDLFADYPDLEEADLQQALGFATSALDGTIDLHNNAA